MLKRLLMNSNHMIHPSFHMKRLFLATLLLLSFALVLVYKFVHYQLIEYEEYHKQWAKQTTSKVKRKPQRGWIFDKNLQILAGNEETYKVFGEFDKLDDTKIQALMEYLPAKLDMAPEELKKKIDQKVRYTVLKKHVPKELALEIKQHFSKKKYFIVGLEKTHRRIYPKGEIAGNVVGYRQIDEEEGKSGLEQYYDKYLKGNEAIFEALATGGRDIIYNGGIPINYRSEEGLSLKTTIDVRIQQVVEQALEEQVKKMNAISGLAVMMDPYTGDIWALAQYPGYNPNEYQRVDPKLYTNRAVTHPSEPGSTVKPLLVASALNMGKITEHSSFPGFGGVMSLGKYRIKDHHREKEFSTLDVIKYSSNIGAVQIASKMGRDNYYQYLKSFGLGEKTEIGLPNESRGSLRAANTWGTVHLGTFAYGYGFSATAIQMIQAMGVIANGGELIAPRLVSAYIDPNGQEHKLPIQRKQRVLSTEATKITTKGLVMVTEEKGTAYKKANIDGFLVAGKTGTANRVSGKSYNKDKVSASFIGFVPAFDPKYVMYISIDEPNTEFNFGGLIAAPVFAQVGKEILPYLGVYPTEKISIKAAAGEDVVDGSDLVEVRSIYRPWWTKDQFLNNAPPETIIPDLQGANISEVFETVSELNLNLKIQGVGRVISQIPASGELVPDDRIVQLQLARVDVNDLSKWQFISDVPSSRYEAENEFVKEGLDEESLQLLEDSKDENSPQESGFQFPYQDIPEPEIEQAPVFNEKDFDKPITQDPKINKMRQPLPAAPQSSQRHQPTNPPIEKNNQLPIQQSPLPSDQKLPVNTQNLADEDPDMSALFSSDSPQTPPAKNKKQKQANPQGLGKGKQEKPLNEKSRNQEQVIKSNQPIDDLFDALGDTHPSKSKDNSLKAYPSSNPNSMKTNPSVPQKTEGKQPALILKPTPKTHQAPAPKKNEASIENLY